jgi:hypothetical protein
MTPAGQGEPGDSRADHGGFHEVVAAAHRGRTVPLAYPQLYGGGLQLGLDAVIAEQEYRNGLAEA